MKYTNYDPLNINSSENIFSKKALLNYISFLINKKSNSFYIFLNTNSTRNTDAYFVL